MSHATFEKRTHGTRPWHDFPPRRTVPVAARCVAMCLAACTTAADVGVWLMPLDTAETGFNATLTGVSADGLVAAGSVARRFEAPPTAPRRYAVTFSSPSARASVSLNFEEPRDVFVWGVSGDGSTLVGLGFDNRNLSVERPFKVTTTGVPTTLPFPSNYTRGTAYAANHNGEIVVGAVEQGQGGTSGIAVRWVGTTAQPIPSLPNTSIASAYAVSGSGDLVAGAGDTNGWTTAFAWSPTMGTVELPRFGGSPSSTALGMSPDGRFIVGAVRTGGGGRFARWTDLHTVEDLGLLAGYEDAFAHDVSADGSVVVGYDSNFSLPTETTLASVWTQATGHIRLSEYLSGQGISVPSGVRLTEAYGISDDGRTIVGRALIGSQRYGYVARVPTPGGAALIGVAALLASRRRR